MKVAFFGDSTTKGTLGIWPLPPSLVVAEAPEPAWLLCQTENYGEDGSWTQSCIDHGFGEQVAASDATHVVINFCINDCKHTEQNPGQYEANLISMVNTVRATGKVAVLETPNPTDDQGHYRLADYVEIVRSVARGRSVHLVDHYQHLSMLMTITGAALTTLMPDGTHPNQATYRIKGLYTRARLEQRAPISANTSAVLTTITGSNNV